MIKKDKELNFNNLANCFNELRDSVPEGGRMSLRLFSSEKKKICVDFKAKELRAYGNALELVALLYLVDPGERNVDIYVNNDQFFHYSHKAAALFDTMCGSDSGDKKFDN